MENKVAIITGGGGNIGRYTALKLASAGVHTVLCDISPQAAQKVADEIISNGGDASTIILDIRNPDEVNSAVQSVIQKYSKVDILVHSAGGSAREKNKNLCNQTDEVIQNVIGVNLMGGIYFARAVSGSMIENKSGRIICVASIVALNGRRCCVDYAASKGGLIAMVKSLAIELGEFGITVNCVSPGLVRRPNETYDGTQTNYLNRNGTADEVASLIAYLASNDAAFITGQNYIIDGGRSLGLKGTY